MHGAHTIFVLFHTVDLGAIRCISSIANKCVTNGSTTPTHIHQLRKERLHLPVSALADTPEWEFCMLPNVVK
jgi:hypothetical protein